MTLNQVAWAMGMSMGFIVLMYTLIGWNNVARCYRMWFTKAYWTNYNIIEAASWLAKASIIVPGLIFGIQIWQLYIIALVTSLSLIWASHKKLLPTLVGFNTLWVWLACMVIAQNIRP